MRDDPEEVAMAMLRAHQAEMGLPVSQEKPIRPHNGDEVFR
jgi:hypothetical protein